MVLEVGQEYLRRWADAGRWLRRAATDSGSQDLAFWCLALFALFPLFPPVVSL